MTDIPLLHKTRQFHSRIFMVLVVLIMLFCKPMLGPRSFLFQVMVWSGYALVISGVLGRIYCSLFIGGRKNQSIVRQGPFSVVRNPLYLFSFIALLGCGLQSGMITVVIVLVVAFALYYPQVVQKEEEYLSHSFGEDYESYKREVPRWEADFSLWKEPEIVEVKPAFVFKTMKDAAVFFVPLPCFMILNLLHSKKYLAVWLQLP